MHPALLRVASPLLAIVVVGAACAGPADFRYREQVEAASGPDVHAVQSARLAELMRSLERLTGDRLPRALDLEAARAGRVYELVSVARAIAAAADSLEPLSTELGLAEADQRVFRQQANGLREAALQLAERAPTLSQERLRSEAAEVDRRCAGCHDRFRIPR